VTPANGNFAAWNETPERSLSRDSAAEFVLCAPNGGVRVLAGIDSDRLRELIDADERVEGGKKVLFVPIEPVATAEALVEQVIARLAEVARRIWPDWYGQRFSAAARECKPSESDVVRKLLAAVAMPGLHPDWVRAAVAHVRAGKSPRVGATPQAAELIQLSLAINPAGLVLVVDATAAASRRPDATVRGLEWIAGQAQSAVIALFETMPASVPPLDRLLYGAAAYGETPPAREPWIAPWCGAPHPLSEVERHMYDRLQTDGELSALFCFNMTVQTVRAGRPRVDLIWPEGRLVVELDGDSHRTHAAFLQDRQRDYELILSGYTVLRLANDDIAQDYARAIEKIRDIVHLQQHKNL
jgi:very-short-patch-repair endonuclease